jgi:hypothetical protein
VEQWAGWLAPAATMIAALMTAANLGTRVTGWGFVIFTIGAVAWSLEAWLTHQPNLLWSNGFLALVGVVGVYRWLGRRAVLEDGAQRAAHRSERSGRPLYPVHALEGKPVEGPEGFIVGHVVGAMADCRSGQISYFVIKRGGISDRDELRAIARRDMALGEPLRTRMRESDLAAAAPVTPNAWPHDIGASPPRENANLQEAGA